MRSIISILFGAISVVLVLRNGGCNAFTTPISNSHTSFEFARHTTTTTINDIRSLTNLHMARNDIKGSDRILACLPYIIPLLDGDRYGRYLFYMLPPLGLADSILLGPFKLIYGIVPFAQLVFFIGLSTLSRNPQISRSVRFNMQQALILDIALIFPSLLGQIPIPMPAMIVQSGSNFVYLALILSVGYSFVSNLSGKVPDKIPVISDAAGSQIP